MDLNEFRKEAERLAGWMADYFEEVENLPVNPRIEPGDILSQLPDSPPGKGEPFEEIFRDFNRIIMPGMTHWESPGFMAYFPANKSYPSVLAEMLTATLGAQCMSWLTSPAATELEERVMEWVRELIALPDSFTGVIQDTASSATLCALLMAREKAGDFTINEHGFSSGTAYTVYCSTETHSSIEKGVKIAGFGRSNLRKIPVDDGFAMNPGQLEKSIRNDLEQGYHPACVIATIGTTGSTAVDPLREIGNICRKYDIFLHADAAYAGTALLLPEMRWMSDGIEMADSFVFNPHKWMFTNFDCSAFFVKNEELLVRTFEVTPEYLKTPEDRRVKNYRDYGIQLGRRFRALKLWFVIRHFGIEGLRRKVAGHIELAQKLKSTVEDTDDFELLAPVPLNTLCFRYHPPHIDDGEKLDELNERLLQDIRDSGKLFLTHTRLNDRFSIRMVIGNTRVRQRHVDEAWELVRNKAKRLL